MLAFLLKIKSFYKHDKRVGDNKTKQSCGLLES